MYMTTNGHKVYFWIHVNVLKFDDGNDCTTL